MSDSHDHHDSSEDTKAQATDAGHQHPDRDAPQRIPEAPGEAPADDTVSLLDLIAVLAKRWKLIFFTTFFAAIGIVLFSLYTIRLPEDAPNNPLPNFYESEAQVLLREPSSSGGLPSGISEDDLGVLGGFVDLSSVSQDNSAELAQELLVGRHLIDQIVEEFNLTEVYRDAEFPRTAARRSVEEGLSYEFSAGSGILSVAFQHTDPVFATDVLQRVVTLLEERFTYLTRDEARARTEVLEGQLQRVEDDLQQARAALRDFQERYGVVDPDSQGQQTLELISEFRRQKFELELEREQIHELVQDRDDRQIRRINQSIRRIEELIAELESGYRLYSPISIPLDEIGRLTAEYRDLRRDLTLKEQIYSTFQLELIQARVQGQDTSRRFQVIEPPEVPEVKAGPSRGTISMIVTITAFFLAVFAAFIMEYFSRAKHDPWESRKIELIKDQFRFHRRQ
ncbi:MAG: GumC family protein [Spirochaetota bacterium]